MTAAQSSFDDRPFVRLEHTMPENRKIVGLSDAAFRLYIEAICWCSRQESDGLLPDAVMLRLGRPKIIKELVTAKVLIHVLGEYLIHDYLRHQRSADEIGAFRSARSETGTYGNHVRWHVARRRPDAKCEHCLKDEANDPGSDPEPIALAIARGSQNDPTPIADSDTDTAVSTSLSPVFVDGARNSSSSPRYREAS